MSTEAEKASAEAVHITKNAQQAIETARQLQLEEILTSDKLSKVLEDAVVAALNRGTAENKYIDVGRIPFICDDIRGIHLLMAVMNENLTLVKRIVFGFVATILLGVVGVAGAAIFFFLQNSPK